MKPPPKPTFSSGYICAICGKTGDAKDLCIPVPVKT